MKLVTTEIAGLTCRVVDAGEGGGTPELVALLCHGFGAPGDDLVPIGVELLHTFRALRGRVRFVFPEAPLSLAGIGMPWGRAWFHLDPERLMAAARGDAPADYRDARPAGLDPAARKVRALVDALATGADLPIGRILLGGFSQGAMVATDVALALEEAPAALCILSGTLLDEATWRRRARRRAGLRVLQSHGRQDPLLAYAAAEALRDLLVEAGLAVEFIGFDGPHTIPPEVYPRLAALLEARLAAA